MRVRRRGSHFPVSAGRDLAGGPVTSAESLSNGEVEELLAERRMAAG